MHYNTTSATGAQLELYRTSNEAQDQRILKYMRQRPTTGFSPEQIKDIVFRHNHTPLTSIRRALSTLTKNGYLVKLEDKRWTSYGRQAHLWQIHPLHATDPAKDSSI